MCILNFNSHGQMYAELFYTLEKLKGLFITDIVKECILVQSGGITVNIQK